jgi:hypothetical protein
VTDTTRIEARATQVTDRGDRYERRTVNAFGRTKYEARKRLYAYGGYIDSTTIRYIDHGKDKS